MGMKTRSQVSSEREKWDKIFEGLVKMLKSQQQQLETLAKERKILEDRIKMQYERWVSEVHLYEYHISQMKNDLQLKEMACVLEAAKTDLMVGLKHREGYLCKLKLEETEDALTDFRVLFDMLSKNSNGVSGRKDSGSKSVTFRTLEDKVKRLKVEYDNLASEKSSQVNALTAENKFAWNQLNIQESQFTDKLNSKQSELEKANKTIEDLISNLEELRSSNAKKDETIERLKSEVSQKEADASRFQEEVSKMSREVELLRKSRSSSCTPVIRPCSSSGRTSVLGYKNGGGNGANITVKKESPALANITVKKESPALHVPDLLNDDGKGSRSSKRKKDDASITETPKLFTSSFKVPRLKSSTKTR